MRELELDSLHADGEHLILVDGTGEQYRLTIDEALRVAVRRDRPGLEALRAQEASPLRPRDIQARIRSGATVEEVAAEGGLSVEAVRRYEGPVRSEQAWIAEKTRALPIGHEVGAPTLGDLVVDRLAARGASTEVVWAAVRRGGEPWEVTVTFEAGGQVRHAEWQVDLQARSITALDDESRWLSETDLTGRRGRAHPFDVEAEATRRGADVQVREAAPRSTAATAPGAHAVPGAPADPLGTAAAEPAAPGTDEPGTEVPGTEVPGQGSSDSDQDATAALLERLSAARGHRPTNYDRAAAQDVGEAPGSAGAEEGEPDDDSASTPSPVDDALFPVAPVLRLHRAGAAEGATGDGRPAGEESAPETDTVEAPQAAPARGRQRGRRTSVPSWDEIVFGARQD